MPPGRDVDELTLPPESPRVAEPASEVPGAAEDELLVVEGVQHDRQAGHGRQPGRLGRAAVDVAVTGVQWQAEEASRAPAEAVLASGWILDDGAAVTGQHVDDLFEQVPLRAGRGSGRQLDEDDVAPVAAAGDVDEGRAGAQPVPRRGVHGQQVNGEALDDGNPLARRPPRVGLDEELARRGG